MARFFQGEPYLFNGIFLHEFDHLYVSSRTSEVPLAERCNCISFDPNASEKKINQRKDHENRDS